jgi:tetratricopeptide (TPR) repeat protein
VLVAFLLLAGFAQDPAEWHARGMAHIAAGELEQARACFVKAIALDPQSPSLRINLGNVLAKQGRTREAVQQFRQALASHPRNISALFNLGTLYLETGNAGRALPLLQRAVKLAPEDREIRKHHLLALARSGSPEAIRQGLQGLGADKCLLAVGAGKELASRHLYELALEQFARERACMPAELTPALGEASALLSLGRAQEALHLLAGQAGASENKHARWILGSALERLGRYPEAFEHFAAVVDLDRDDPRARMALGLLGLKARTPQLSAKVFQDAAQQFPGRPEFELGLALVAQAAGDPKEAEDRCRALLRSNASFAPASLLLAALYLDAARWDLALDTVNKLGTRVAPLLTAYMRAAIAFEQSRVDPSLDSRPQMRALEAALDRQSRFVDAHVLLARFYRTRDVSAAGKHLRLALEAEPKSWQAQSLLAQLHRRQGDASSARVEAARSEITRRQVHDSQRLLWQLFYGGWDPP